MKGEIKVLNVELIHPLQERERINNHEDLEIIDKISKIDCSDPFTFIVRNISTALINQLMRDYKFEYSKKTLEVDKDNFFDVRIPPSIAKNCYANKLISKKVESLSKTYNLIAKELMIDKIIESDNYERWYELITVSESKDDNWNVKEIFKALSGSEDIEKINKYLEIYKHEFKSEYAKLNEEVIDELEYILPNGTKVDITLTIEGHELHNLLATNYKNTKQWELNELINQMTEQMKIYFQ